MNVLPNWISNWLTLKNNENINLSIIEEKVEGNRSIALIEAIWAQNSCSVEEIQLFMELTRKDITCSWKPHLSPNEDMVIGDLFFQSPAIILEKDTEMFALIPDLNFIEKHRGAPHFMDYVKPDNRIFYGLGEYEKTHHVYHRRTPKPFLLNENQSLFRFYLIQWEGSTEKRNLKPVVEFLWDTFAKERMIQDQAEEYQYEGEMQSLEKYAKYTYDWAFNRWESVVWQEFELNQDHVGGCVFIVRAAQSPGAGQENNWREKKSLWNQAWFSSLRSAYGYRLWGDHWNNQDMVRRSELAKNFALSAPQVNGLFPSVFWADENQDWKNGYWGHSDRRPDQHDNFGHLLDMSWTCYWMLKWYTDIEKDHRLLAYVQNYADRLVSLQKEKGNFPAWVHLETGNISPYLLDSPETSMHAWLLGSLYVITNEEKYLDSSLKAISFVIEEVIPNGRWEDFETYWSCSRMWEGKKYGEKDKRSGLYNQCNFSIYWTAEALKELYKITENPKFLRLGEQILAELSLYQAIWEPEYLKQPVLGGFSVMNTDDEWNDARQSLFAVTYNDYFRLTGKTEYKFRSLWAMKASFYMMYCPENTEVKKLYEITHPHFTEKDYGFEMENAHHGENIDRAGEFTIFDWGNGSASASLAELLFRMNAKNQ